MSNRIRLSKFRFTLLYFTWRDGVTMSAGMLQAHEVVNPHWDVWMAVTSSGGAAVVVLHRV